MLRIRTRCLLSGSAWPPPRARPLTLQFDIVLDGLQETPPVVTPATGTGTLFLDDINGNYTISGTFQDLIGHDRTTPTSTGRRRPGRRRA